MLINSLFPEIKDKHTYLFSEIIGAILSGEVQAGILIHESRFRYRELGLHLLADLGQKWEELTAMPLPLGAIVASRQLGGELTRKVDRVIRRSVEYAFANPAASRAFVKSHAQELDDRVIDRHIAMFVNKYTVSLGEGGRQAISRLLGVGAENLFV
jgi:1,4-dihydroxy-6-naphthoate synthase